MFPPKPTNRRGGDTAERVIVAVKVEKVISKAALAWALTHAARPGDCITLLAIISDKKTGRKRFWDFPRLKGDCRSVDPTKIPDRICQISESCSQMVLQVQDIIQVKVRVKVIAATSAGAVAAEAKNNASHWVILDKKLKRELKHCMDELHCNIVIMKGSQPKILRLNLTSSNDIQTPFYSTASSPVKDGQNSNQWNMKHTTPVSSPEYPNTSHTKTSGETSLSSADSGASVFVLYGENPLYEGLSRGKHPLSKQNKFYDTWERPAKVSATPESSRNQKVYWIPENHSGDKAETDGFVKCEDSIMREPESNQNTDGNYLLNSSIREAVSLCRTSSTPPPLCSFCQSKAPVFGKPPKQFHYKELEEATDGFSDSNFVAEGGFGSVHRGILGSGLIIAVKQLKFVGPQRDVDFCREVRVLSCAQHRNVVLLIGFCIEGRKRLLVYEYICNGSLDFHLYGNKGQTMDWQARLKIAIGTARGLRYLHEDCRVGCIVHRNLRPNNILLTHDFEPLVADFGLARLHGEWELCDKNQLVATSWYLAPEYFNDGKITEKVDIYAFGLVLLELITGQRTNDLQYSMEHQFLLDNIHTLAALEPLHVLAYKNQLLDPRLVSHDPQGLPFELHAMGYAASLCLQQDPDLRPSMSKVVKMLEGGTLGIPLTSDMGSIGCRSGHMQGLDSTKRRHSRRLSY